MVTEIVAKARPIESSTRARISVALSAGVLKDGTPI